MATAHHFFTKESAEIGPFESLPHPPEQLVASAYAPKMSQKAQALSAATRLPCYASYCTYTKVLLSFIAGLATLGQ